MNPTLRCVGVLALVSLLIACVAERVAERVAEPGLSRSTTADEPPERTPARSSTAGAPSTDGPIRLVRVATFDQPLALAARQGDPAVCVAEKGGRVWAWRDRPARRAEVLDLSGEVSDEIEQGLLGLAFAPDGRHLYVNYTDGSGDTRIVEFRMDGAQADPASRRELLVVEQPLPDHNGGHLAFGPDGMLYVGLGDGGGHGDPLDNAQRLDTLLGKLLRLDPHPYGDRPYSIPADNPFVGREGVRPEIWAYGLRNPWRFSFDQQTGDLWIADVGQHKWEEINVALSTSRGGENYGWNRLEGTDPFQGSAPAGTAAPVHTYPHDDGSCAVTGGVVYRGGRIPSLQGRYVYGDFCSGLLRVLSLQGNDEPSDRGLGVTVEGLSSFGEDQDGEIYVTSLTNGGLYRIDPSRGEGVVVPLPARKSTGPARRRGSRSEVERYAGTGAGTDRAAARSAR